MIGHGHTQHGFNAHEQPSPPGTVPPFMMLYNMYSKTNAFPSGYGNQRPSAAPNPGVFHHHFFGYPAARFGVPSSGGIEEEEDADGTFEVHDSHLRAPIMVRRAVVYPSVGSQALFSAQHQSTSYGGRNVLRICEPFQEGRCLLGEGCSDIHVHREHLIATRQAMISWLHNKEREFQQTLGQDPGKLFRVFCADLKEVVEVPITAMRFTKGLYVNPTLRARRARSTHQNQYAMMALQVPTACGLFSVDPSQCKWGRWCNQVHIELKWMQFKRAEFETWSNSLEKRFNDLPPDHLFTVHDPQLKTSLNLPKASIAGFSRGLFQGSAKKAPSVCMLFQRNRCTASSCCNQIHVVPPYLFLHRRWVHNSEHLSEEERKNLMAQMDAMLVSLSTQSNQASCSNDVFPHSNVFNPEACLRVPTPPPQDMSSSSTGGKGFFLDPTKREEQQRWPLRPSPEETLPAEQERFKNNVKIPTPLGQPPPNFQFPQQPQQPRVTPSVASEAGGSTTTHNPRSTSTGYVMPLGEFVVVADGDERSQSSLQASQSNTSHMGRSYKHTNNPYALGGNVSCTASPSFGWVQPVRSAGNSVTTVPTGSVEVENGGRHSGNCVYSGRMRVEPCQGITDRRPPPIGIQQHDFDASLHISSPLSLHWSTTGSVVARNTEESPKVIPEMDSSSTGNAGFLGHF